MDANTTKVRPNPREKANILSVLFWTWTVEWFRAGCRGQLGPGDLCDPLAGDRSGALGDRLEKHWFLELESKKNSKKKPSFLLSLSRCFLWEMLLYGLLHGFNEIVLMLGAPLFLGILLRYFHEDGEVSYSDAVMSAGGMTLAAAMFAVTLNQSIYKTYHIGARIRIAICSVVYRKAQKLSTAALGETAPGKLVNLIAGDVHRFDFIPIMIHYLWSAPTSALIVTYFLYVEAGYAGLLGILAIAIIVPIQSYIGKLSSKYRLQTSIKTDERVRLMNEIISGVQVIKMYAWEKPFCAMVALARKLELRVVRNFSWIRGIYMTFGIFTPRAAIYCTLVAMIFFNQEITAEKIFVFSAFLYIVARATSEMFVRSVAEVAECLVAVRRLQTFLMYNEVNQMTLSETSLAVDKYTPKADNDSVKSTKHEVNHKTDGDNWAVRITNATAKWEPSSQVNTLNGVNIELERGKMYMMIGAVGAGKSSLISAILGELKLTEGSIEVRGELSYAAQEPWIFGSTVRQNIIFGQRYDRERYQNVVEICALLSDFKQFPQGDQTLVGERGRSLSGGQKARISLARAVYRQADLYLLDDPLSAVDVHVGKHLFEECLNRYLSEKTRFLVTHQLQYIKDVDGIILLEHGSCRVFSHYQDLFAHCPEYAALLVSDSTHEPDKLLTGKRRTRQNNYSRNSAACDADTVAEDDDEENLEIDNIESTSKGVIQGSIFIHYLKSGDSWCYVITVVMFFILTQALASATDFFIPILVNEEESRNKDYYKNFTSITIDYKQPYVTGTALTYVYIYTGLVSLLLIVAIIRSLLFYVLCIRNSQRLHDRSFGALIRTSMRFFNTNPSGRILNRFSKDMGGVDELLPKALFNAAQMILIIIASKVVVCIVNPFFLIPLFVITFILYRICKVYLKVSQNMKRLEGMTRSPVFTHLNATINGLTTIRALGAQDVLKLEFDKFQDTHSSAWYMFVAINTAFGFSLDILCFIFITIVTFTLILFDFGISGAEVGLAITTLMSTTGFMQWGLRQSSETINQMTSVERVLEYSLLPPEDNITEYKSPTKHKNTVSKLSSRPVHASENWPTVGCIKFQNVFMRYAEDEPPVLKGLELVIKPREKVGIVGRTGAGKSSLISALFRLAKVEGVIQIDGVDTGSIYLEDLRRNISIIPQDPVLFTGTLRKNLDPFNEYQDSLLWNALDEVELKKALSGSNGLESRVLDCGTNFSVGQRQLICLARAILRNNRILLLDEATANVDPHTDSLIQRTIRKKFADCTVLTIAHRLNTIMDSDKVLVMENGQMVEFDHPHVLLKDECGLFTSLVKETGPAMTEQLTRIAKEAYDDKHRQKEKIIT